jgi:hypothetical protein
MGGQQAASNIQVVLCRDRQLMGSMPVPAVFCTLLTSGSVAVISIRGSPPLYCTCPGQMLQLTSPPRLSAPSLARQQHTIIYGRGSAAQSCCSCRPQRPWQKTGRVGLLWHAKAAYLSVMVFPGLPAAVYETGLVMGLCSCCLSQSSCLHHMSQSYRKAAQHGTARHSTAQHSTAQHSTAQHSTAQHSTAQDLWVALVLVS